MRRGNIHLDISDLAEGRWCILAKYMSLWGWNTYQNKSICLVGQWTYPSIIKWYLAIKNSLLSSVFSSFITFSICRYSWLTRCMLEHILWGRSREIFQVKSFLIAMIMIMKLCFITKIIGSFKEENASRMHNIMSGTEKKFNKCITIILTIIVITISLAIPFCK